MSANDEFRSYLKRQASENWVDYRQARPWLVLMVAGLALSYVPGEHFAALRFIGSVAFFASAAWFAKETAKDAWTFLRTHTAGYVVHRLVFWAVYALSTLWLLFVATWWAPWRITGWLVWTFILVAVDGIGTGLVRELRREMRERP